MHAIKEARRYIERNPDDASAKLLVKLVLALETESEFPISEIYKLDYERFNLALKILHEWRLDRYYPGKGRLFDLSLQVVDMEKSTVVAPTQ